MSLEFSKTIIDTYAKDEQDMINKIIQEINPIDSKIIRKIKNILKSNSNFILINYTPVLCNKCNNYKYVTFEVVESNTGHFKTFETLGKCQCILKDCWEKKASLPEIKIDTNFREIEDRR